MEITAAMLFRAAELLCQQGTLVSFTDGRPGLMSVTICYGDERDEEAFDGCLEDLATALNKVLGGSRGND
jgi:hypothetical protein